MRTLLLFLLLALPAPAWAAPPLKAVPLEVSGDTITVVRSFPAQITARPGADFYIWSTPDGVKAVSIDNVLTITAAPQGPCRVSVIAITVEIDFEKKAKKVVKDTATIDLNVGTPTPPPPIPPPDPPKPPAPVGALRVLVVYESSERGKLTPAQDAILSSVPFRSYLDSVCADDPQTGSKKAWWMLDKDVDASGLAQRWQDLMKRPRTSVPYLYITKGDAVAWEGPLPAGVDETKALVAKYAGAGKGKK